MMSGPLGKECLMYKKNLVKTRMQNCDASRQGNNDNKNEKNYLHCDVNN